MTDNELDGLTPEELKELLHSLKMLGANCENWSYVSENAEWMNKKAVADALGQILSFVKPLVNVAQGIVEIEALTKMDPLDLL